MTHAIPWHAAEFEARLRARQAGYHIHHPFSRRMAAGECSPDQIRGWVANRFYYQACIPLKDAAILSNCEDRDTRREWVTRILDHDGSGAEPGGIEAWLRLGEAVSLSREALCAHSLVLPGVRFAVDAYVSFARRAPWQEAVCSSLTEMFAPEIHRERLAGWPQHYPWIEAHGLAYFRSRRGRTRLCQPRRRTRLACLSHASAYSGAAMAARGAHLPLPAALRVLLQPGGLRAA